MYGTALCVGVFDIKVEVVEIAFASGALAGFSGKLVRNSWLAANWSLDGAERHLNWDWVLSGSIAFDLEHGEFNISFFIITSFAESVQDKVINERFCIFPFINYSTLIILCLNFIKCYCSLQVLTSWTRLLLTDPFIITQYITWILLIFHSKPVELSQYFYTFSFYN